MTRPNLRRLCAALAASLLLSATVPASAHRVDASEASALSLLPLAVVVSAPATLLAGGALLTVVAVETTARASVWVLERASDGARATVELGAAASTTVGTVILVSAVGAGWVLSTAGQAIAFVPNEIGAALLHHERVTR